jgi:hypothetical protein
MFWITRNNLCIFLSCITLAACGSGDMTQQSKQKAADVACNDRCLVEGDVTPFDSGFRYDISFDPLSGKKSCLKSDVVDDETLCQYLPDAFLNYKIDFIEIYFYSEQNINSDHVRCINEKSKFDEISYKELSKKFSESFFKPIYNLIKNCDVSNFSLNQSVKNKEVEILDRLQNIDRPMTVISSNDPPVMDDYLPLGLDTVPVGLVHHGKKTGVLCFFVRNLEKNDRYNARSIANICIRNFLN